MVGRELDVLWSGEPDLRIEELGTAGNGWERLGKAGNGWERLGSCASCALAARSKSVFSITMVHSI